MAFTKTLIRRLRNPMSESGLCFHTCNSLVSSSPFPSYPSFSQSSPSSALPAAPNPFSIALRLTSAHSRLFFPLCLPLSLSGPLFLSAPPWKLSQLATPIYFRGKAAVVFPKDLLKPPSFPIGFGIEGVVREVGSVVRWRPRPRLVGDVREESGANEKFLNAPNLVSISRMVSGPIIGWMIMNGWYCYAFGALVISGATDWLDGFLARKMAINSVFGSYLDPLADKILIGCVAVAMVKSDLLHPGLVTLMVVRDLALVSGAVYKRASIMDWQWNSLSDFINLDSNHREKVEPLFISKVNTLFQLILVAAALLQPEFGNEETQVYITYLSWLVASTTTASSVGYCAQYLRTRPGSA